ncbi:hypothetical protein V1514DRAFT_342362 [Lipomyces japonicus]|uniref:uncharacterized protein n=1 Tax=Lipomyces japonicus TaxID=56871 RepID=UPI0034D01BBA
MLEFFDSAQNAGAISSLSALCNVFQRAIEKAYLTELPEFRGLDIQVAQHCESALRELSKDAGERTDSAVISIDGNFQHYREKRRGKTVDRVAPLTPVFVSEDRVELSSLTEEKSGCSSSFSATKNSTDKHGWKDERGLINAVCRHGTCLLLLDNMFLGEHKEDICTLLKAAIQHTFVNGKPTLTSFSVTYDISCRFQRTLKMLESQLSEAFETSIIIKPLIPSFHVYAHESKCRILFHPGVNKCGLTNGEGVERDWAQKAFLVYGGRKSSKYHRRQAFNGQTIFQMQEKNVYLAGTLALGVKKATDQIKSAPSEISSSGYSHEELGRQVIARQDFFRADQSERAFPLKGLFLAAKNLIEANYAREKFLTCEGTREVDGELTRLDSSWRPRHMKLLSLLAQHGQSASDWSRDGAQLVKYEMHFKFEKLSKVLEKLRRQIREEAISRRMELEAIQRHVGERSAIAFVRSIQSRSKKMQKLIDLYKAERLSLTVNDFSLVFISLPEMKVEEVIRSTKEDNIGIDDTDAILVYLESDHSQTRPRWMSDATFMESKIRYDSAVEELKILAAEIPRRLMPIDALEGHIGVDELAAQPIFRDRKMLVVAEFRLPGLAPYLSQDLQEMIYSCLRRSKIALLKYTFTKPAIVDPNDSERYPRIVKEPDTAEQYLMDVESEDEDEDVEMNHQGFDIYSDSVNVENDDDDDDDDDHMSN